MQCTKKINDDLYFVGGSDRRLTKFENIHPIPSGITYNSYLLLDEKTVLFDTVDSSIGPLFFQNIEHVLNGRKLDFLVVNHMEPDHCTTMEELVLRYPDVTIVGNKKTISIMKQFYSFDVDNTTKIISEGEMLNTGKHTLKFLLAPMVHWPETMVTYDITDKILFSGDAFGTFGAFSGNIFVDELDFEANWLSEARRYYFNVVGKYGLQVQALLKKASSLDIKCVCPLHGPIWRSNVCYIVDKYKKWSSYTPEENSLLFIYASVYGFTENVVMSLANRLGDMGIKNIAMYDVSSTDQSILVSEAFRCSHIVLASSTYNSSIFPYMESLLNELKLCNLQNRKVSLIQNGTWAAMSGKQMLEILETMKDITVVGDMLSIKSNIRNSDSCELKKLADDIYSSMNTSIANMSISDEMSLGMSAKRPLSYDDFIDSGAIHKLSYGLFVLTSKDCDRDNGCITNTVIQVANSPKRIAFAVNKDSLTHDIIIKTGLCNVSVLTESVPFEMFKHFGFQSGKDIDKFESNDLFDVGGEYRTENGIYYISNYTNAVISGKVIATSDLGSHTLFTADITSAKKLSDERSVTYDYYHTNIKPVATGDDTSKKGYICKICGYIYEGEPLPADFICPICKHGAEDFEPLTGR